ncbi:hypothetical protein GF327_01230 [Candidatus Woesearchaeota archaeon]|nr:hypothetical protein [Candidatus Woesearchaeota archaeon]
MKVNVTLLTPFKKIKEKREIRLELENGETFYDLIEKLSQEHGDDFKNNLFESDKKIKTSIMIMVNGRTITDEKNLFQRKLKENEEYVFCAAIGGG